MDKEAEPEAYTIGWIPFINTRIYLDSRPLIPRTETEYWVDIAIKEIRASGVEKPKILDLCAGSGCIGVAVLKEFPDAQVDFAEIDASHHSNILKNVRMNGIDDTRVRILSGSLFEEVNDTYDFIFANPPYVDMSLGRVEESVLIYEPHQALDGGKGGLEIIEGILAQAPEHITPAGILYLEHEPEQIAFLAAQPGYLDSRSDQYGALRFSRFSGKPAANEED